MLMNQNYCIVGILLYAKLIQNITLQTIYDFYLMFEHVFSLYAEKSPQNLHFGTALLIMKGLNF